MKGESVKVDILELLKHKGSGLNVDDLKSALGSLHSDFAITEGIDQLKNDDFVSVDNGMVSLSRGLTKSFKEGALKDLSTKLSVKPKF